MFYKKICKICEGVKDRSAKASCHGCDGVGYVYRPSVKIEGKIDTVVCKSTSQVKGGHGNSGKVCIYEK